MVRRIWLIAGIVALGIVVAAIIAALIFGTEIRIERQIEVVGPDEPVYYMIVRGEPVAAIERELQKNPQVVHDSYIINGTLLAHAADEGREDVVRLLLEMGANPDGFGRPGEYTPLMIAVFRGNEEIAAILIEHFADPDLGGGLIGRSPRQMAEDKGNQRMLSILAEAGNEDGGDGSDSTPANER